MFEAVARPGGRGHAGKGYARSAHGHAFSVTQASADKVSSSELARHAKGKPLSCSRNVERKIHPHTTARNIAAKAKAIRLTEACLGSISTHQAEPSTTVAAQTMASPGMASSSPLPAQPLTRSLHPMSLITKPRPLTHLTVAIVCTTRLWGCFIKHRREGMVKRCRQPSGETSRGPLDTRLTPGKRRCPESTPLSLHALRCSTHWLKLSADPESMLWATCTPAQA